MPSDNQKYCVYIDIVPRNSHVSLIHEIIATYSELKTNMFTGQFNRSYTFFAFEYQWFKLNTS